MSAVAIQREAAERSTEKPRDPGNARPYLVLLDKGSGRPAVPQDDLSNGDPPPLMLWGEE